MIFQNPMKTTLQPIAKSGIIAPQSEKEIAEPENSFNLLQGEQHANRAFFVRCFFTPKERPDAPRGTERHSMVVRNGKGSPFAVILVGRFLSPLRTTAQTLRSLAVVPEKFIQGLSQMLFTFLCVDRTQHNHTEVKVKVSADSENEARWLLPADYRLLLDRPIAKIRTKLTACSLSQGGINAL